MIKLIFFLPLFGFFILSVRLFCSYVRWSVGVCGETKKKNSRRLTLFVSANQPARLFTCLPYEHVYEYCTHWLHYTFCIHIVQYTWNYKRNGYFWMCEAANHKATNKFLSFSRWHDGHHLWQRDHIEKRKNFLRHTHRVVIAWEKRYYVSETLLYVCTFLSLCFFLCSLLCLISVFFLTSVFFFFRFHCSCCCCCCLHLLCFTYMACEKSIDCSENTSINGKETSSKKSIAMYCEQHRK